MVMIGYSLYNDPAVSQHPVYLPSPQSPSSLQKVGHGGLLKHKVKMSQEFTKHFNSTISASVTLINTDW
jgi:hypothetical protein